MISPDNRHRVTDITARRLRWLASLLADYEKNGALNGALGELATRAREWARDLDAERKHLVWFDEKG